MTDDSYKVVELALDDIEANAWNPNSMTDADMDRLVREITEVGFIDPVQVVPLDTGKYRLIGGEHRVDALRRIGRTSVLAVVLTGERWQDEDLQKLVTVRLNVLKGRTDPGRMAQLYDEMARKYGEEALRELFAYTDAVAWNSMVKTIGKGLKKAGLPEEISTSFAEAAKEAETLEDLGKILNMLFAQYGDTVSQNFMVFTYGGKSHLYVACDQPMWKQISKIAKHCKDTGVDVLDVLRPALESVQAKILEEQKAAKTKAPKAPKAVKADKVDF